MGRRRTLLTILVLSTLTLLTACTLPEGEYTPTVGGILVPTNSFDAAPERGTLELHRRGGGTVGEPTEYDTNASQYSYAPLPRDPDPALFENDVFPCDAGAPSGARGLVIDHMSVLDGAGARVGRIESTDRHDHPDAHFQHLWVHLPDPVELDTSCPHATASNASVRIDVTLPAGWHVVRKDTNDTASGDPAHAVEFHALEPGASPDSSSLVYVSN